jgi:hypothetical protein
MKYGLIILLVVLQSCSNHQSHSDKQDSSLPNDEKKRPVTSDCFETFFDSANQQHLDQQQIIQSDGKAIALKDFVKLNYDDSVSKTWYNLKDVDQNGESELWLRGYTGGAHCCDEWKVYEPQANHQYKLAAQLTAGEVCIQKNTFIYSFNQVLGYFRSCFACGYDDSTSGFIPIREMKLKYVNQQFLVMSLSIKEQNQLLQNLAILKRNMPLVKENEEETIVGSMQKEFAMNIAVHYYTHKKDWISCEALIKQYYSMPDAKNFTKELKELLDEISKENSF